MKHIICAAALLAAIPASAHNGESHGAPSRPVQNAAKATASRTAERSSPDNHAGAPATAVCMGASSGGAQGAALGLSFGTSWTDDNCMLLEQVRTVAGSLGDMNTAQEMMCSAESYREARRRMGKPCGGTVKASAGHVKKAAQRTPE
jgi:hypothetical protein